MMSRMSRWVLGVAVLLLGTAYVLPLWQIGLKAPQYPEGLGMYIWVDQITGQKPHDLKNINGLNHYIGMKEIVPESIPELRLMPKHPGRPDGAWASGPRFGVAGRPSTPGRPSFSWGRWRGWPTSGNGRTTTGTTWTRPPRSSIPGMSYQPPLLGTKKLLNFFATSFPASGGWIAFVVLATAVWLSVREFRRARDPVAGAAPA